MFDEGEGYFPAANPHSEANKPTVRQQLNPAHRRHPDWPEEWYVNVPRTRYTWSPKVRLREIKAFPSLDEAKEFAQIVWQRRWGKRVEGQRVEIAVQREFTVDRRRPDSVQAYNDALETSPELFQIPGVVVRHKLGAPMNLGPRGNRLAVEDLKEPERQAWLQEPQSREAEERRALARQRAEEQTLIVPQMPDAPSVLVFGAGEIVDKAVIDKAIGELPENARLTFVDLTPASVYAREVAKARGLEIDEHYTQEWRRIEHEWQYRELFGWFQPDAVVAFRGGASGPLVFDSVLRTARLHGLPMLVDGKEPAPLSVHAVNAVQHWLNQGRDFLAVVRRLANENGVFDAEKGWDTVEEVEDLARAAISTVLTADGSQAQTPVTLRETMIALIEHTNKLGEDIAPKAIIAAQSWAAAAERLTASELGLFKWDTLSEDVVAELTDVPVTGLAASTLANAVLDNRVIYATPTPSGKIVAWRGQESPLLEEPPTPTVVDLKLYNSMKEVQEAAGVRGAGVEMVASQQALEMWEQKVRRVYTGRAAEIGQKLIGQAMQRLRPEGDHKPPPTVRIVREPQPKEWRVAPWGQGMAVVWGVDKDGENPHFARVLQDGSLGRLPTNSDVRPLLLRTDDPRGYAHIVRAASERWGQLTPAELPASLHAALKRRGIEVPAPPNVPDDILWQVTPHPRLPQAYAWGYRNTNGPGTDPVLLKWAKSERHERWEAPTREMAVERAMDEITGAGLLCVRNPGTPFEIADQVIGLGRMPVPKVRPPGIKIKGAG